ncbi:putative thioredoxin [Microdochium bolleyi]|uniref:Putative thioredoxin n=1 Tax=Microdochium bolleyi TaxID=196109 RepID=A0A136IZS3_9PEZI|nr:putative thioredoxin [Microdochium bolleyi]
MVVHTIESLGDFKKAAEENKVVILAFFGASNSLSRVIAPVFEKASNEPDFQALYLAKVDVESAGDVPAEVGVRSVPTFIAFVDGQKFREFAGANPTALENLLQEVAAAASQ